ncbi:hypothetical protein LINPERPRIM_LOCUS22896 [Linum perenne]
MPKRKGKKVAKQAPKQQGQPSTHPSDLDSKAPKSVDHSKLIVSKARNQGDYNSCWAIATSVVVEAFVNQLRNEGEEYFSASPQDLIDHLSPKQKDKKDKKKLLTRLFDV